MKVLLIDDMRIPTQIAKTESGSKEGYSAFTNEEVTIARTYHEGIAQLTKNGTWYILLLDNDLGTTQEGKHILYYLEGVPALLPKVIILVTANQSAGELMM